MKIYERQGEIVSDDGERRSSILLKPDSTDPRFGPLVLAPPVEEQISVVGELVSVLR